MIKIDIFSGFLGAGKTTLIKKLIEQAYKGEKIVLIENEFGDIGIDSEFLKDTDIQINELNSGCICCSLVGDFSKSLSVVAQKFSPDRIIIEPSGVGKLSDVIKAVKSVSCEDFVLNGITTVADVLKTKMYIKNFGEFFCDQIENANSIIFSRTKDAPLEKISQTIDLIKNYNDKACIITTDWDKLDGHDILSVIEQKNTLLNDLEELKKEHHKHHHHDEECHCHEHHHDEECHCHEHHHDEECHCHEHHHDEECHCHEHHHDEECHCHEHGEHHHHADEIFTSCGFETVKKFSKEEIKNILDKLSDNKKYGNILRAKGVVDSYDSSWIHFDFVPGEADVRYGNSSVCGRICVIGSQINQEEIKELFGV